MSLVVPFTLGALVVGASWLLVTLLGRRRRGPRSDGHSPESLRSAAGPGGVDRADQRGPAVGDRADHDVEHAQASPTPPIRVVRPGSVDPGTAGPSSTEAPRTTGWLNTGALEPSPLPSDHTGLDDLADLPEGSDLAVGSNAIHPQLRTQLPVDLSLRREAGRWTINAFDTSGASVSLGEVPLRLAPLALTHAAHRLRIERGRSVEHVDLEDLLPAEPPVLVGGVRVEPQARAGSPGLAVTTDGGLVTAVLVEVGEAEGFDLRAAAQEVAPLIRDRRSVWDGDPTAYAKGLRLDLLDTFGWWPLQPPGASISVAVCGPGIAGTATASTGEHLAFVPVGEDHVLVEAGRVRAIAATDEEGSDG